jgi:homoserine dehydrogenase
METYKLAFLGFGNVGQALVRLLQSKQEQLAHQYNLGFRITAIATGRHGAAINPAGIDPAQALALAQSGGDLSALGALPSPSDALDFIRRSQANVLFENTPVNYQTGQPALDHLRLALACGMHAITANKGPVVHGYRELTALARTVGRRFFFESTVMDGAPIFSLFRAALPGANLMRFRGVLNSTTNLILTRMEAGESFADAVHYAQSIGIAETDPSGDIDGWDAAVKVAALVTVLMDYPLKPAEVDRQGIRALTPQDVAAALQSGQRWKLVCSAQRTPQGIQARVAPERVPQASPMFSVQGTTSIVEFETDVLGNLSIVETDPGPHTTAYGLLADFLNAVRG